MGSIFTSFDSCISLVFQCRQAWMEAGFQVWHVTKLYFKKYPILKTFGSINESIIVDAKALPLVPLGLGLHIKIFVSGL